MQLQLILGVVSAGLVACVPGGPIYVGPPLATLEGLVLQYENQMPIPYPEVCVFSTDTLCVRGDKDGKYKVQLTEVQLGTDGTIRVRFRTSGLQPAAFDLTAVKPGDRHRVSCAISSRTAVGSELMPCFPVSEPDEPAPPANQPDPDG